MLGTYRPVDVIVRSHPLHRVKHELQLHGQCHELALDYWSETAIAAYVAQRFADQVLSTGLSRVIHQRTDGHPLFVVNVVDEAIRRGFLRQEQAGWILHGTLMDVASVVPDSLLKLIEYQLEQADPDDRALLEAASVAGIEFSAAAVAASINQVLAAVEVRCEALARQGMFVQARGSTTWPDGTVAARYGFIHALYHEVLYTRVGAGQKSRLHQSIGTRLEAGYGEQAREMATELAVHFERSHDAPRAVHYLRCAGDHAAQRHAHQEAMMHLMKSWDLLNTLPDTHERAQQELSLLIKLGPSVQLAKGNGTPE